MTSVFVVAVDPVGVVGVFSTEEAAADYFNELQGDDDSLGLTGGSPHMVAAMVLKTALAKFD
jgi:hypothetical protein